MKNLFVYIALAALMLTPMAVMAKNDDHRVTICHVPPGNPGNAHTITIDRHALKAHLGPNDEGLHGGDSYGPCRPTPTPSSSTPSPEPTATPSPTPSPTPTSTTAPTPTPSGSIDVPATRAPERTLPPTDTE